MTGSILRGIGSFYTVLCDEDGREYTLRAQKKLRHQKMTPDGRRSRPLHARTG